MVKSSLGHIWWGLYQSSHDPCIIPFPTYTQHPIPQERLNVKTFVIITWTLLDKRWFFKVVFKSVK